MSELSKALNNLRQRERDLKSELTKVSRAIASLEGIEDNGTRAVNRPRDQAKTCKVCSDPFTAARKDARYCGFCKVWRSTPAGRKAIETYGLDSDTVDTLCRTAKRKKEKPVTLIPADGVRK